MQLSADVLQNSVLIVDDDTQALDEMCEYLQEYGLTVHIANNVELAIKLAKEQRPAFIIMDYLLHGYTGTEAVSAIHKFLPETQVIMISALADLASMVNAKDFGVIAVIKKPLSMGSVGRFIADQLEHKRKTPILG